LHTNITNANALSICVIFSGTLIPNSGLKPTQLVYPIIELVQVSLRFIKRLDSYDTIDGLG